MCVRQLAFIPAYIRGLEFAQPRDHRPFEGSWQEGGVVVGQPLQVYGSERKVKALQACNTDSLPDALILSTDKSNYEKDRFHFTIPGHSSPFQGSQVAGT